MAEQRDWLHEIKYTAKYDNKFHDFLSDILLASNLCLQIQRNSSPQVTNGLKQFSDLHLRLKLKHFSVLSALQSHQNKDLKVYVLICLLLRGFVSLRQRFQQCLSVLLIFDSDNRD